jgi:hypothetical protein
MDEAAEDQPQVRGLKKRGRPPKVRIEGEDIERMERLHADLSAAIPDPKAQDLALRIWKGQSPDLPRHERIAYVKAGVETQGMSMEGVILPPTRDS